MSNVTVQVQAPVVHADPKENLLAAVNQEIAEFDRWFQTIGNEPMVNSEKTLVRTYFAWKLGLAKGAEPPGAS